jgi:hypothetical protein
MRYIVFVLTALCAACATAEDQEARSFQQTGVVEGFYGPPWSHQDRLDILRFMGRVGLTHYYYAPKDDPFHRHRWREQYPETDLARLRELAVVAREAGVQFVYAISPGETMVYADSGEYDTLKRKLDEIGALGVTAFAIFLDDVPPTLEHDADRRAFETVAQAHAHVINRLHEDLSTTGATLAVTPTTYTDAWGDREYLRQLGELVVPEVPFFWTGIDVQPPEITAEQARAWGDLMSREPLIWDNYPVNDYARWRPFLGPLRRRGPDLSARTLGILSNPMNEAHASMIPLATLAEYARDPRSYDPAAAAERALVELYGEEAAQDLESWVRIYAEDGWHPNLFQPLFVPGEAIEVQAVRDGLAELDASLERLGALAERSPELLVLVDELRPFVSGTRSRLESLEADPRYAVRDARLVFRSELDRKLIPTADAPVIDGDIGEWSSGDWEELHGSGTERRPRVAFRSDPEFLYAAVHVPITPRTVRRGPRVGEGDHIAFVLQHDTVATRTHLTPDDVVVLVSPPTQDAGSVLIVRSLDMGAFTAKWQAPKLHMTFSEFFVTTFGTDSPAGARIRARGRRIEDGYAVEVAVPRPGRDVLRANLTVAVTIGDERRSYSLAQRDYMGNPATYAELVIR